MAAWHNLSLTSRGARFQFTVAIFLISILPALTMFYLMIVLWPLGPTAGPAPWAIVLATALLVVLGFFLLAGTIRTIGELRRHLERIAEGDLPGTTTRLCPCRLLLRADGRDLRGRTHRWRG